MTAFLIQVRCFKKLMESSCIYFNFPVELSDSNDEFIDVNPSFQGSVKPFNKHHPKNSGKKERRRRTAFTQVSLQSVLLHENLFISYQDSPKTTESTAVFGEKVLPSKISVSCREELCCQDSLSLRNSSQDMVSESKDKVEETE
jgi:hypothetical protein